MGYASYFKISKTTDKKSRAVNYVFNLLLSEVFFFAQDGNIEENMLTVVDCFPQVTIAIPSLCCTSATLHTTHFKGWYQQNDVYKTKRPVRRRPADFVTKGNMHDVAQRCLAYLNI